MKLIFDELSAETKKKNWQFFLFLEIQCGIGSKGQFFAKNNNKLFPSRLIHQFSCQFSLIKFICCLYIATHAIAIIILPIPFIFSVENSSKITFIQSAAAFAFYLISPICPAISPNHKLDRLNDGKCVSLTRRMHNEMKMIANLVADTDSIKHNDKWPNKQRAELWIMLITYICIQTESNELNLFMAVICQFICMQVYLLLLQLTTSETLRWSIVL